MTRPVSLPSENDVREMLSSLRASSGEPVAAKQLATSLGLSNATFWRHFPDIAHQVSDARRDALRAPRAVDPTASLDYHDEAAALRREVASLRLDLELAIACIQRLTLENDLLRREATDHNGIVRLDERR